VMDTHFKQAVPNRPPIAGIAFRKAVYPLGYQGFTYFVSPSFLNHFLKVPVRRISFI
jgi:hypothetical protein